MKLQNLVESQEKKLGDLEINGKIVAPKGIRRDKWDGNIWCDTKSLTSLEGAPQYISGDFMCQDNQLTSLEGAPQRINEDFWCSNNKLTSLAGGPQHIGGDFMCHYNQLASLTGGSSTCWW